VSASTKTLLVTTLEAVLEVYRNGDDQNDPSGFEYDLEGAIRLAQTPVTMLCIRDPDYENEYVADGPINTITIDPGGNWNSYKDFCSCLQDGDHLALEFVDSILSEVQDMSKDNPVRQAVETYFAQARTR
jgi:hypothetical protein